MQKALQRGIGAGQVVDAGSLEELPVRAQHHCSLPGAEHQVVGEDISLLHLQLPSQQGRQRGGPLQPPQGLHVLLQIVLVSLVHVPQLVDGETGNGQQVPVDVDEAGLHTSGCPHRHPTGHGQRAV